MMFELRTDTLCIVLLPDIFSQLFRYYEIVAFTVAVIQPLDIFVVFSTSRTIFNTTKRKQKKVNHKREFNLKW